MGSQDRLSLGGARRQHRLRQEEVAARLGVSTTPVREAFRDLLADGLIGLDSHRGVLVRGHTLANVRELCQLRILLEPMLAACALLPRRPGISPPPR